jgi:RNA polymerase sigma factor (sigma-70 family)
MLRAYLRRRCRDRGEVEDVLQETLLRAARYRATLSDTKYLRTWTMRIAVNVMNDRVRRLRRRHHVERDDELLDRLEGREPIPGDVEPEAELHVGTLVVDRNVALSHLAAVFGELRSADRAVLRSYYEGKQSCAQTADECGIPSELVKVRLFRARRRLLRALHRRLATISTKERSRSPAFGERLATVA